MLFETSVFVQKKARNSSQGFCHTKGICKIWCFQSWKGQQYINFYVSFEILFGYCGLKKETFSQIYMYVQMMLDLWNTWLYVSKITETKSKEESGHSSVSNFLKAITGKGDNNVTPGKLQ